MLFKIKVCPCTCREFSHQRTFCQHVLRVFFNASLKNSVFVLFKFKVCPWLALKIFTPMNVFICASREFWRLIFPFIMRELHSHQNSKNMCGLKSSSSPCLALKKLHQWSKYPENSCYHAIKNWNFFIICKSHFCAVLQSFCKILFDFCCCRAVIKNCTTFKVMEKASVIQIY